MPEPLLTFDLYEAFITANGYILFLFCYLFFSLGIENHEIKLKCIRNLLANLTTPNYMLLKRLISLLKKIASFSHINKMDYYNLAVVMGLYFTIKIIYTINFLGPNILRSATETLEKIVNDTPIVR